MEEYFMMLEDTKDENISNNAASCHFGGCCLIMVGECFAAKTWIN